MNTSIHEGLPITFLEALAYGTLLVSCRNPDDLTSKFGEFVGTILGVRNCHVRPLAIFVKYTLYINFSVK